jgi:hypothetical protein
MTTTASAINLPKGTLAYRQYQAELADGSPVSLAFTLSDSEADTYPARFAHEHNAIAFGFVSVLDAPGAPERPSVWMVDTTHLSLASEAGDRPISEDLQDIVELYLRLFFIQIVPIAPHLASIEWGLDPAANDNRTAH